jgi:hypothetical protein
MTQSGHPVLLYFVIMRRAGGVAMGDSRKFDALFHRMYELGKKLGPEYAALVDGLQDIDPQSEVGQEISSTLDGLDNLWAPSGCLLLGPLADIHMSHLMSLSGVKRTWVGALQMSALTQSGHAPP